MGKKERVEIWNSFLELAREQAEILSRVSKGETTAKSSTLKGGALPDEEHHDLALLLLCNLAIEARANHLCLYNNFVRAMEDMNVIIKGIRKERIAVLKKLIV